MFFIMCAVDIVLICVMRKRRKFPQYHDASHSFEDESHTVKIILFLFELSYLFRFIWDQYLSPNLQSGGFTYEISYDISLYLDILPFIGRWSTLIGFQIL